MNINKLKEESLFYDFKTVKFKSTDEFNRELFAVARNNTIKLRIIEDDLSVRSTFAKKEVEEIISELRYGTMIIVSKYFLGLFKRYYVISKGTLNKYNNNITKEEFYSIRPKIKWGD